jgi:predicted DNA-binding transcriptional regulator AlpA
LVFLCLRASFIEVEMVDYSDDFPLTGYVRGRQIYNDPKTGKRGFTGLSRATWYQGIKDGIFPPPFKPTPMTSVWRAEDVRAAIEGKYTAETRK